MTEAHAEAPVGQSPVLPFGDPSRGRRLTKVALWLVGVGLAIAVLELIGVDVTGWFTQLWDQIKAVPTKYVVAGLVFQTGQTTFAALSYYGILRAAYHEEVQLAPKEFDLLWFLACHPRRVFSRDQLMDRVWGYTTALDTGTVTVHIRRLREKIEVDPSRPRFLETVWGVGYRFTP